MTLSFDTELDEQITNTDITITKTQVDGHTVTCIQNGGISLYYADGAVIMENGKAYQVSELYPDYSSLPAGAAKIFQMLSFTTSRSGENVTCSLTAEGENARTLLKILMPEQIDNLSDTQKLKVELTSANDEIQSLCFSSEGTLMDDDKTPYTISAELKPAEMDKTFAVPEPVKETVCSRKTESETVISEVLFQLQSHEIRKIAQQESCIFVGRCADFVLREEDVKMLKVFVRAPVEWRIKRKMQQEHLSREKAAHLVHKMDKRRKKYYESYTGQIWGTPGYYDLCIDTGTTEFEEAVTTICSLYNSL